MIGHHVPRHQVFMFLRRSGNARLRAREVRGALPPGRAVWGAFGPPREAGGVWEAAGRPILYLAKLKISICVKLISSRVVDRMRESGSTVVIS